MNLNFTKIKGVLVVSLLVFFNVAFARTLKLTNGEWAPWLSKNLREYGAASHIVSEAFKRKGHEVEYGFFPWKRAFDMAKDDWDGSLVWGYNQDREQFFYYSKPIFSSETVFFHLKDKEFDWNSFDDLSSYTIGTTTGYFYSKEFKEALDQNKFKVAEAASDEINMKKLISGRIDLFISDKDVGFALLYASHSEDEINKIKFHPKTIKTTTYHLLLNKNKSYNGNMLEDFNAGLTEMEADGTKEKYISDSRKGLYKQ